MPSSDYGAVGLVEKEGTAYLKRVRFGALLPRVPEEPFPRSVIFSVRKVLGLG